MKHLSSCEWRLQTANEDSDPALRLHSRTDRWSFPHIKGGPTAVWDCCDLMFLPLALLMSNRTCVHTHTHTHTHFCSGRVSALRSAVTSAVVRVCVCVCVIGKEGMKANYVRLPWAINFKRISNFLFF